MCIHNYFIRVLDPQKGEYLKTEETCKNNLDMKLKKYLSVFGCWFCGLVFLN